MTRECPPLRTEKCSSSPSKVFPNIFTFIFVSLPHYYFEISNLEQIKAKAVFYRHSNLTSYITSHW